MGRQGWSFEDGGEKEYLCRAPVALALLAGLPQFFSTTDLGCKEKSPQVYGKLKGSKQI